MFMKTYHGRSVLSMDLDCGMMVCDANHDTRTKYVLVCLPFLHKIIMT